MDFKIYPDFRIRLINEKPFYGPGAQQLLQLTEQTGSLRNACCLMGLSYSKGRKIVAVIEQQTGRQIMESRQGGKTGGNSTVTEAGIELVRSYDVFCTEANQMLHELFDKHFKESFWKGA